MLACAARSAVFAPRTQSVCSRRASLVVRAESTGAINPSIKKDVDKVVDFVNVPSDLADKAQVVYCRCWRSDTFPLCNGAHVAHNKATGDNVGPLIVKKD